MTTSAKWSLFGTGVLALAILANSGRAERGLPSFDQAATTAAQAKAAPAASAEPTGDEIVATYCGGCHNDRLKRGDLVLTGFKVADTVANAVVAEKIIRKLQAGMMPPPGSRRPAESALAAFQATLEAKLDAAYVARPNPGARPFPRLNRSEYAQAIKDLLTLDVDAGSWLPLDQKSANFDNIADEQTITATLLESYLNAASDISRLAVGDRKAEPLNRTYTNTSYVSQHPWDRIEGAPYGTRGGMVVNHVFPVDAEYVFEVTLTGGDNSRLEDLDLSLNGERIALVRYEQQPAGAADGRGAAPMETEPILVKAGQYKVAAAFLRRFEGPYEDLIRPHDWSFAGGGSGGSGITTLPHLRDLIIKGPFKARGVSETAARRKIFSCRPTATAEERSCARTIVTRIGAEAYRRPLQARESDAILKLYDEGAAAGGFEEGVRTALEAILASPHFIFRLERQPETAKAGASFAVNDLDLASRLSFFLWGTPPDADLLAAARRGELATAAGLEKHARRLLADARADALGPRFAGQWLRLQDIDKVHPDPNFYPNFEEQLAGAMKRETESFFNHLVRADRSLIDLFTADYTFLNDRLARHYGIPGVAGSHFRKVTYPDATRRGILGQGSMLVQTSFANRTSPVLRGKWVMEVLLGTPPPPPPQDGSVPPLEETAEATNGRPLTTRERMELHRKNPTCNSCHRFMDPIGLALDRFDVTGKLRARESGMPLDTRGDFYDGTPVSNPAELVAALAKRPTPLVRTFTENLMAYALGRRVEHYDQPVVRAIAKAAAASDYRLSSFIVGVVKSDAFRMKRAEAAPASDAAKSGNARQ
jgi:mono/diheme cytochrome c family protein